MADRATALLFSALICGGIGLVIAYFTPRERIAPHKLAEAIKPKVQDHTSGMKLGLAMAGLAVYGLIGMTFGVVVLVFLYGLVVLVFRHAFGIELPFGRFN